MTGITLLETAVHFSGRNVIQNNRKAEGAGITLALPYDPREDLLYVVGGYGHAAPSSPQHGAQYQPVYGGGVRTNEQHIFSLSTSE